jgi:hypothetical protein
MKRHSTGLYHAIVFDEAPPATFNAPSGRWVYRGDGRLLERLPVVVGATVGIVTLLATTVGILYGAA